MKKKQIKYIIITLVVITLSTTFLFMFVKSDKKFYVGDIEQSLYDEYRTLFVKPTGAVIANYKPVAWCPNAGIGCDNDITSEAIARLARYDVLSGHKEDLDLEIDFYYNYMRHPTTNYMMWKLNSDLTPSLNGDGKAVSAVDAELIMIEALLDADKLWEKDSNGRTYLSTARLLMDSLKEGVFDGKYIPFCMYPEGNNSLPCEKKVFLGYLNLPTLKKMCSIDSFWCSVYDESKLIMIGALNGKGAYTVYVPEPYRYSDYLKSNGGYQYENAPIHANWVIRNLVADGGQDTWLAVKPYYDEAKNIFLNEYPSICQEFNVIDGCKKLTPTVWVYTHYLEMASMRKDEAYAKKLIEFIYTDRLITIDRPDQFANIAAFESLGYARMAFGTIEYQALSIIQPISTKITLTQYTCTKTFCSYIR